nr:leucine-rich repeat-containing protein 51-like [Leptinotarsa decemlineata]
MISEYKDFKSAIGVLDEVYVEPKNEIFARIPVGETVDEYLQAPKQLSKECYFKALTTEQNQNDFFIAGFHSAKFIHITYSYFLLVLFHSEIGLEGARYTRVAGVPEKGENKKFLTRSLWLNNNRLKNFQNLNDLVEVVLEFPAKLGWIDLSFNRISEIDQCILKFPSLKILYFHGNCISELDQVYKLRPLKQLRSITFHGNPIANHPNYRSYIVSVLPQIANLDFTPVVATERKFLSPKEALKKGKEVNKSPQRKPE